ncbi:MAG: NAD(P)-dependent oxidoreductase [Candidatus Muiribacteriota bacterium]
MKMEKILVGHTGFVGSNIAFQTDFNGLFNSKNIGKARGIKPQLMVYAGVPGEKFIANKNEKNDLKKINQAISNIKKIQAQKVVLISTVDVYTTPFKVDENSKINYKNNSPYGKNRYILEEWIKNNLNNYHIIRLPALFGKKLKKNFVFDLINPVPAFLKEDIFIKLKKKNSYINNLYKKFDNGFYKCSAFKEEEKFILREFFNKNDFNSLNFTDSRSEFQFYPLEYLWNHIKKAVEKNIKILNITTEPVSADNIFEFVYGKKFQNYLNSTVKYNVKSVYSKEFGGSEGYFFKKDFVLNKLKEFIKNRLK